MLETVAGINSLDEDKKREFAQSIGRQGGATSAGARASMDGDPDHGDPPTNSADRIRGGRLPDKVSAKNLALFRCLRCPLVVQKMCDDVGCSRW